MRITIMKTCNFKSGHAATLHSANRPLKVATELFTNTCDILHLKVTLFYCVREYPQGQRGESLFFYLYGVK